MAHIHWKDRYNIGFRDIDAQHKVLLDLLNDLIDLVGERRDAATVAGIFQRLCEYAVSYTHLTLPTIYSV